MHRKRNGYFGSVVVVRQEYATCLVCICCASSNHTVAVAERKETDMACSRRGSQPHEVAANKVLNGSVCKH